jgi:hypothetical protein
VLQGHDSSSQTIETFWFSFGFSQCAGLRKMNR